MEEGTWWIILIILIIIIGYFFLIPNKKDYPSEEIKNNLTEYLNQLGVTLYYSETCPYCKEQKEYINFTSFQNKVDIENNTQLNLIGIPAFEYNNETIYGLQTHKDLGERYGYKIN